MEPARSEERLSVDALEAARLVSRSCEIPDVSFQAFLGEQESPRFHWADPDGLEIVCGGAAGWITASGPERFAALRARADALFGDIDHDGPTVTRPRVLGGIAFDADYDPVPPWRDFPASAFVLPHVQLTRADETTWLTVTGYGPDVTEDGVSEDRDRILESVAALPMMRAICPPPGVASTRWTTSRTEWNRQVSHVLQRIRNGALVKAVLAMALEVELESELDVVDVLERLRRTYPNCYRFLVEPTGEAAFFGPSPERLVKLSGRRVETEALAGSAPRGDTPEADGDLAASLVDSEKIRHEQQLVVDAIRDKLEPLGDVTNGERRVRKLTNIQHLQTPITAELASDEHVLDLVEALHPTPAVGGLPPDAARVTIRETESFERGWYASPVGWFDANGDGEFAVGIRSGVARDGTATLFAGNGIVADSDPDDEWEEIQPKYRPILDELE